MLNKIKHVLPAESFLLGTNVSYSNDMSKKGVHSPLSVFALLDVKVAVFFLF